jgi:hypothetical protein
MAEVLVRASTPEERELARYLVQIEVRHRQVAELEAELESLKLELGFFEAEYHARVGTLFVELDRIRLAIEEYDRRIAGLTSRPDADPADVEREVHSEFSRRHEEVRNEEEETRRFEEIHHADRARPQLDGTEEDEAKRLFRELAKRFHPDLARTIEERHKREQVMRRVNEAFRARNLDMLRALMQADEIEDSVFEARSIGEKLIWAIREVARLETVAEGLLAELDRCRATEAYHLWQRQEAGETVLETLASDISREIACEQDHLAALESTYRGILEARS